MRRAAGLEGNKYRSSPCTTTKKAGLQIIFSFFHLSTPIYTAIVFSSLLLLLCSARVTPATGTPNLFRPCDPRYWSAKLVPKGNPKAKTCVQKKRGEYITTRTLWNAIYKQKCTRRKQEEASRASKTHALCSISISPSDPVDSHWSYNAGLNTAGLTKNVLALRSTHSRTKHFWEPLVAPNHT